MNSSLLQPVIILVDTQLSQNIGTTARAMLNFGLTSLRLVRPLGNPLSRDARALAAGADEVLEQAKTFDTTAEAIADLHMTYATTARHRDMTGLHLTPAEAARHMQHQPRSTRLGILFGPERAGLTNEDVALCSATVSVPLNPSFSSLNLAQAVLLMAYEVHQVSHLSSSPVQIQETMATKDDLQRFFDHLVNELDQANYFRTQHKRPKMIQSLHTMFSRTPYTAQEIRTLRGVISTLVDPHGAKARLLKQQKYQK